MKTDRYFTLKERNILMIDFYNFLLKFQVNGGVYEQ